MNDLNALGYVQVSYYSPKLEEGYRLIRQMTVLCTYKVFVRYNRTIFDKRSKNQGLDRCWFIALENWGG